MERVIKLEDTCEETLLRDFYNVVTKLRRARSKSSAHAYSGDLYLLYSLMDEVGIINTPDYEDYSFKSYDYSDIKLAQKYIDKFNRYEEMNLDLSENILGTISDAYPSCNSFSHINIEKSYLIAKEYLKRLNLADKMENIANNNHLFIVNQNYNEYDFGQSVQSVTDAFSPYLVVKEKQNINDAVTFVHEMAHINERSHALNVKVANKLNVELIEVCSHFEELCFYDYLDEISYNPSDIKKLKISYLNTLRGYAVSLKKEYEEDTVLESVEDLFDKYNVIRNEMTYSNGLNIAMYLYNMYKNDPTYIRKLMTDLGYIYPNTDMITALKEVGIDYNDTITCDHIKKYVKENIENR